jgi:VCBS repeat-containing protein
MDYQHENKEAPNRKTVSVLGATYAPGKPENKDDGRWRYKLDSRSQQLRYLQSGERYWYSQEWFGSEKRQKPA